MFSVRLGIWRGSDSGDVLEVDEHAVERLFLRLNTLTLASVADELRDAMLFTLPLTEVAERLSLRQIALPTSKGAFLCHYDPESRILLAKTWLPADAMGPRWDYVRRAIRETNEKCGGEEELARLFGTGMKRAIADGDCRAVERLVSSLSKILWLKEEYLPQPDVVGDIWDAAKRQALTSNPGYLVLKDTKGSSPRAICMSTGTIQEQLAQLFPGKPVDADEVKRIAFELSRLGPNAQKQRLGAFLQAVLESPNERKRIEQRGYLAAILLELVSLKGNVLNNNAFSSVREKLLRCTGHEEFARAAKRFKEEELRSARAQELLAR